MRRSKKTIEATTTTTIESIKKVWTTHHGINLDRSRAAHSQSNTKFPNIWILFVIFFSFQKQKCFDKHSFFFIHFLFVRPFSHTHKPIKNRKEDTVEKSLWKLRRKVTVLINNNHSELKCKFRKRSKNCRKKNKNFILQIKTASFVSNKLPAKKSFSIEENKRNCKLQNKIEKIKRTTERRNKRGEE